MLNIAKKLAAKSLHKQHHHACIITKGGKIIATGYNHKFMHAERDAIRKVITKSLRNNKVITGLELYSFRWRKGGQWGNAKPCMHCMLTIESCESFVIESIFYTNEQGVLTKL